MYPVRQYQTRYCSASKRRCCGIGKKSAVCPRKAHSQSSKLVIRRLSIFFLRRGSTLLTTGRSGRTTSPIPGAGRSLAFHGEAYSIRVVPYRRRPVPASNFSGSRRVPSRAFVRDRFAVAYSCPYPCRVADRASVRIRRALARNYPSYYRGRQIRVLSLPETVRSIALPFGSLDSGLGLALPNRAWSPVRPFAGPAPSRDPSVCPA